VALRPDGWVDRFTRRKAQVASRERTGSAMGPADLRKALVLPEFCPFLITPW
jgi:hypothetical protein